MHLRVFNGNIAHNKGFAPVAMKESMNTRVVPLDNFMIYKYIIRLDRPD